MQTERKIIYDFTDGKSAKYLIEKLGVKFEEITSKQLIRSEGQSNLNHNITITDGGISIKRYEEDNFQILFQYKSKKYSRSSKLPVYHVFECETVKKHRPFKYSNSMPVMILVSGVKEEHSLRLCTHCKKEIFKENFFKRQFSTKKWYDIILEIGESGFGLPKIYSTSGYHILWSQISEAYREKVGWRCQQKGCNIDLSGKELRKYLHTHHLDGNKKNNSVSNFEALCLLCHSLHHPQKMKRGLRLFNVSKFIESFRTKLNHSQIAKFEKL